MGFNPCPPNYHSRNLAEAKHIVQLEFSTHYTLGKGRCKFSGSYKFFSFFRTIRFVLVARSLLVILSVLFLCLFDLCSVSRRLAVFLIRKTSTRVSILAGTWRKQLFEFLSALKFSSFCFQNQLLLHCYLSIPVDLRACGYIKLSSARHEIYFLKS